jgi:DNA-binding beta-propeller fold protein YncE
MVDGAAAAAKFQEPYGMAVAGGKLIVADAMNHRIREIALDGTVTTLAGSSAGFADGPVASAKFNRPQGVRVDSAGNIYVADTFNARVRMISGGMVTTIIGTGEAGYVDHDDPLQAQIFGNEGLCVSSDGTRVFIADGGRGEDVPHNFIRVSKH